MNGKSIRRRKKKKGKENGERGEEGEGGTQHGINTHFMHRLRPQSDLYLTPPNTEVQTIV